MRVGIDLPWFASAAEVRAFAQAVDELGYDHLGFSAHVASTNDTAFPTPSFTFDEPWRESATTAAFLAAVTRRIEISSAVLLLPLCHPVLAAKQVAEVHNLADGRLRVGVSISWNVREMETLGVDSSTRGARFEEQVAIMRRLWTEPVATSVSPTGSPVGRWTTTSPWPGGSPPTRGTCGPEAGRGSRPAQGDHIE